MNALHEKTETIADKVLELNALDLFHFLQENMGHDKQGRPVGEASGQPDVYVVDDQGRTFDRVLLNKDTLTDGSEVFNLVLCSSEPA